MNGLFFSTVVITIRILTERTSHTLKNEIPYLKITTSLTSVAIHLTAIFYFYISQQL